ncbi:MAG TPA: hypothetical protein VL048_14130 [Xanthobacteraceae bacterium]|nr:hypothetical protein [Xanthobacteraceae bacterium]
MVARVQALTGLHFDSENVSSSTTPNLDGAVVDSTDGWVLDHSFPHYRTVLSSVAIEHGYLMNTADPSEEHINERVHWSVLAKRANARQRYSPSNLPENILPEQIAQITDEERALLGQELLA